MGIRVFISGNSGNKEIVTHQARILMILDGLGIEVEVVDITAPGMKEATDFMRSNGKKKDEERHVLPPQIFNGDKYCGDYEDFDVANEDDELEEFLGIPRASPKFDPNAGSNTGDADKLEQPPAVNGTSDDKSELQKEEVQELEELNEDTQEDPKMNGADKYERPELEDDVKRKKKLHVDVHEERAGAGFQDLKNAGRFWRATQIMGTRKTAKKPHKLGFLRDREAAHEA